MALAEELDALSAIYAPDELSIESRAENDVTVSSNVRCSACVTFHLSASYPSVSPDVSVEGLGRRGAASAIAASTRALAAERLGQPMLFELLSHARGAIEDALAAAGSAPVEAVDANDGLSFEGSPPIPPLSEAHAWCLTRGVTTLLKKSTFLPHVATGLASAADARAVLSSVLADPRIARATHSMWAYRILLPSGGVLADNDDDGEAGAGSKLALMLHTMDVRGAMVIVTRWYGGVLLGSSRFGVINNCARELLVGAGFGARR